MFFEKDGKVVNVVIPDVAGKTVVDATNELIDAGFEVSADYKYVADDKIEEELVVKTSPEIGTKRKKGSEVILYVSTGEGTYVMENFIGQNYLEVKGKIEAGCQCNVSVETKKVDEKNKKKENTVLETKPKAGESSKLGSTITIVIPEVEYKYPDFTSGYTRSKIDKYAKEHEINVEYKEVEDSSKPEGTIIKQSRAKGSVVTPGATIVITITTKPEAVEDDEVIEDKVDETDVGE